MQLRETLDNFYVNRSMKFGVPNLYRQGDKHGNAECGGAPAGPAGTT